MRFLFICLLVYVGYRIFKALMLPAKPSVRPEPGGDLARVDDVMVKDPYCEVYFPKRNGIKGVVKGETHYFCSKACKDKYLERIQQGSG